MFALPRLLVCSLFALGLTHSSVSLAANRFADPLDTPARQTVRSLQSPIWALASAGGERVIGVGPRGHILLSDDRGQSWRQVASPVSVDLTAVQFPTSTEGWIVGFDGVVLHSTDAGASWTRVLDGREIGALMVAHYDKVADVRSDPELQKALEDAHIFVEDGPIRPFFDVWFRNAREGWLVGQFNLILHTSDGGRTWQPWLDRTENPEQYSLHAIQGVGDDVYIVGELGLVLKLTPDGSRFSRVVTPYAGTWFNVFGSASEVYAVGLRGSVWRSSNGGETWGQVTTEVAEGMNAGSSLPDGRALVLAQTGRLLSGTSAGQTLEEVKAPGLSENGFDLLVLSSTELLVSGRRGVSRVLLSETRK